MPTAAQIHEELARMARERVVVHPLASPSARFIAQVIESSKILGTPELYRELHERARRRFDKEQL